MSSRGEQFSNVLASHCEVGEELGRGGTGVVYKARFVWKGPEGSEVSIGPVARKEFSHNLPSRQRERAFFSNTQLAARVGHVPGYAFFKGSGSDNGDPEKPVIYSEFIDTGWNYDDFAENIEEIPPLTCFLHACIFLRLRLQAWKAAWEAGIFNTDQKPANNMPTDFALHKIPSDGGYAFLWLPERVVMVDMDNLLDVAEMDESHPRSERPLGTFAYMAPEQTRYRPHTGSELFSIGISALEILTGRAVFFEVMSSWRLIDDITYRSDIIIRDFLEDMVAPMEDDLPRAYGDTLRDFKDFVEALTRFEPKDRPSTEDQWATACRNNPLLMQGPSAIGRRCENVRGVTREQIIQMLSL